MTNNSTNNTNGAITIEAEDLNFDNDFMVSRIDAGASGGKIIRVRGDRIDGDIRNTFTGPDGVYDLTLYAYDEDDGVGQFTVWVNGQKVNTTLLNKNLGSSSPSALTRFQIEIENLTLKRGDQFRIEAKRGGADYTSLDKIVFTPKAAPITEPSKIVIEAEDLNFDNDFVVSTIDASASGGKIIRVRSNRIDGDIRESFTGPDGLYNLTLDAYDENDGVGQFTVWVNGQKVNTTLLNKNLGANRPGALTRFQIGIEDLTLKRGDQFRIEAKRGGAEFTSLDKITFEPVASTPINGPVTITSNGGGDFTAVTVDEGQTAVTDFETNVGDANVVYSINAGADQDLFNIDPVTGQLSFKEAPDWEAPADEGRDNVYEVNVIAVGGASGDGQFVSVVVNNLENPDPTPTDGPIEIISNNNPAAPGNSFSSIVLNENLRTVTDFAVLGSEAGVTYRINDGADKDLFWINPETGVLSFKEAPDWENPQDAEGNNNYEVNVLAERNGQFDAQFLTVTVGNVNEANAPAPVSVYLIGGQSNAVGEGLLSNLPAPYTTPFPRAKIWGAPSESFVTLAPDYDGQTSHVGPEFSFGRTIVNRTNQDVYLVKYGLGATSLAVDWAPSGTGGGAGRQFNTFIDTVNQALDTLTTNGITYELDGLVWQQGESDTYDATFADQYQDNLTNFIGTVRDFYGANLEVSIGLIRSDLPTGPDSLNKVQTAQRVVSGADPRVNLVDTDALGPASTVLINGDPTHYSAAGQVALGNAYGNSFAV